jgi:hypothetical protein
MKKVYIFFTLYLFPAIFDVSSPTRKQDRKPEAWCKEPSTAWGRRSVIPAVKNNKASAQNQKIAKGLLSSISIHF